MSTVKHTIDLKINQPIDVLFHLFSAEGEKLWVPGWDYENIMGTSDLHEDTNRSPELASSSKPRSGNSSIYVKVNRLFSSYTL